MKAEFRLVLPILILLLCPRMLSASESIFEKYQTSPAHEDEHRTVSIFKEYQSDDPSGSEDNSKVSIFDTSKDHSEGNHADLTGPIVKTIAEPSFNIDILSLKAAKRDGSSYESMSNSNRELARERALVAKQSWKSKMDDEHGAFDSIREQEKRQRKEMEKKREDRRQSWMEKQQAFMAARRAAQKAREEQWERERRDAQKS